MPQMSDTPAAGMLAYGWYMYTSNWSLEYSSLCGTWEFIYIYLIRFN